MTMAKLWCSTSSDVERVIVVFFFSSSLGADLEPRLLARSAPGGGTVLQIWFVLSPRLVFGMAHVVNGNLKLTRVSHVKACVCLMGHFVPSCSVRTVPSRQAFSWGTVVHQH